jgi:hypothetical protein
VLRAAAARSQTPFEAGIALIEALPDLQREMAIVHGERADGCTTFVISRQGCWRMTTSSPSRPESM